MNLASPKPHRRHRIVRVSLMSGLLALSLLALSGAAPQRQTGATPNDVSIAGAPLTATKTAVINFTDLAEQDLRGMATAPPVRALYRPETLEDPEEPLPPAGLQSPRGADAMSSRPTRSFIASPSPSSSFMGLDDIPMVDSSYIIIPPDVGGAVGLDKVMCGFNNNYRIQNKATGATISTVGTATFWAAVTLPSERLSLTDPRTTYDPYNNRWIACMQTVGLNGAVLVGVSQTSDPSGAWNLYKFTGLSGSLGTNYQLDYPILGFNKNWVAITINRYTTGGTFSYGVGLVLDYPQLRAGVGTGSLFTLNVGAASTHFCTSPAVTYSATVDELYLVTHLSSGGATYAVDVISGTPGAPVYTVGAVAAVRPGGGWTQPGGNQQPQSAPIAGASTCGATPCKIESADSQVRSSPVYRNGNLWYAQTIGLPAGVLTRTAAQWTKITASTAPAFLDGGRVDDPTATATNGGKWYDHVALSVNANEDMMIGFTQFSSTQHPSAGYAMRLGTDGLGTIRDPFVAHAGDDYYHKTFSTTTGRNRWGDFTTVQVDPCDDQTLWALQEYGKTRVGTDDGNTGSNSSRWSSWWAAVAPVASLTCPSDQIAAPGATVNLMFRITNTGGVAGAFDYSISDAAGWGGPVSGTTPVLAPASFFDVFVDFTVSSTCTPLTDAITLSAQPVAPPQGCTVAGPVACTMTLSCDAATATLLGRFDVQAAGSGADIDWWSDAVGQISEWNLDRGLSADGPWTRINPAPIAMGSGGAFHFHDDAAISGSTYYRLLARMTGGGEQALGSTRISAGGDAFSFAIVGRNPSPGSMRLGYTLPRATPVRIDVFSVTGERVRTLVDRMETPGTHSVDFALRSGGRALSPGIYMVRISAGSDRQTLRVVGIE